MNVVLAPLFADLTLAVGAAVVLVVDLLLPLDRKGGLAWLTIAVLAASLGATFGLDLTGAAVAGAYVGDGMSVLLKQIFLGAALLTVLGSRALVADRFPRRQGEFWFLLLCSVLGMTLLGGVRDIVLLVVCFELMGIPLYILAAYARDDGLAVEGALKLFLVGAVSSVTLLFGLSLLFGLASSTYIPDIAATVASDPSPAALLGVSLFLAGVGFKLGVFPFHMWVPDTYEGSTTPFVAFLSVAPKAAGLTALLQVLFAEGGALLATVVTPIIAMAAVTLVFGNIAALNQSNIKRLLAFSGVGHMGLILMALALGDELGLAMMLFYLLAYLFTNMGTFLVAHAVESAGGDGSLTSFDGLSWRSDWLAAAMLLFLLSLAGIPFVVGFWAKLYIFLAAWNGGLEWMVVLGALLSVVGLFYYLRVVRAMYMSRPDDETRLAVEPTTAVGIVVCLVFVVGMGLMPGPFVAITTAAASSFFAGL